MYNKYLTVAFATTAALMAPYPRCIAAPANTQSIFNRLDRADLPSLFSSGPTGVGVGPFMAVAPPPPPPPSITIQTDFGYSSNPDNTPDGFGSDFGLLDLKYAQTLGTFPFSTEVSYQVFEDNHSSDDVLVSDMKWVPSFILDPKVVNQWKFSAALKDKFTDLDGTSRQNLAGVTPLVSYLQGTQKLIAPGSTIGPGLVDLTAQVNIQDVSTSVQALSPAMDASGIRYTPQIGVVLYLHGDRSTLGHTFELDAGDTFNDAKGSFQVYQTEQLKAQAINFLLPDTGKGVGIDASYIYGDRQYSHAKAPDGNLRDSPSGQLKVSLHFQDESWAKTTFLVLNLTNAHQWGNAPKYAFTANQVDLALKYQF